MRHPVLPNPYQDWQLGVRGTGAGGATTGWAAAAWGSNNRAIYVPWSFPYDAILYEVRALGTNTTGNYDLGFYSPLGARIASKGTTAMANAPLVLSISDMHVFAGQTYYIGLVLSSTSGNVLACAIGGSEKNIGMGVLYETSALPLPATMTPVVVNVDFLPMLVCGLR